MFLRGITDFILGLFTTICLSVILSLPFFLMLLFFISWMDGYYESIGLLYKFSITITVLFGLTDFILSLFYHFIEDKRNIYLNGMLLVLIEAILSYGIIYYVDVYVSSVTLTLWIMIEMVFLYRLVGIVIRFRKRREQ